MSDVENYGRIGELVSAGSLPSSFGAAQDLVAQALDKVAYRDLIVETGPAGDHGYYGVTLLCKELSTELFGSGLKLIYFPGQDQSTPASALPVSFEYRWPIRKYFREFEVLSFAGTGRALFDILLELIDTDEAAVLEAIVACFINDPAPYPTLIAKFQQWGGNSAPWNGLSLANLPPGTTEAQHIGAQIEMGGFQVSASGFEALVNNPGDLDATLSRLVTLAKRWLGEISRSDLERLLRPQFAVALEQVAMAIEAPRTVLIPLNPDGSEDTSRDWRLGFTAGGMRYDSETGFDIAIDQGLAVDFPRAMIPRIGVTLAFEDIDIDLSRTSNIAAADAEGRPPDFMGVSIGRAEIGLPKAWFTRFQPANAPPSTLAIVARDSIIGTGGYSGTIGIEAIATGAPPDPNDPDPAAELQFVIGKEPASGSDRKGFIIGFSDFDMKFRQNRLLESRIKGSLTIPGFDPNDPQGNRIDVELFLDSEGDFEITAGFGTPRRLKVPNIFSFDLQSVSVGKNDRGLFLSCTGDISFAENDLLGGLIKQPIHVDGLMVGSDGSVSLAGGEFPLPKSASINLGPAKVTITAIQFGSFTREHGGDERSYRFIGFSGGVSCDPGGFEGKGDGVRFCYSVDGLAPHRFLEVSGIGIGLTVPSGASPADATLRIKGYLKMARSIYQGSIEFALPQLGLTAAASMIYDSRVPAWFIRVDLMLPIVIQIGSLPLGFYSFSGGFGWKYCADKQAPGISPALAADASWGDYYRGPPQRGIVPAKFSSPVKNKGSRNPFSIGVGAGICTTSGSLISMQVFLLVSMPNLILIEGGFQILEEEKLSPTDTPPFYAYILLAPGDSFEFGAGVDYLVPKDSGKVLKLNVVLKAYFSFRNRSAWYIALGDREHPCTAEILGLFTGYSYLVLQASGIETGAGVSFNFSKHYGPIGVEARAYLDFWAYVSFLNGHAGGGIAMGGSMDVSLFGFGFYIGLTAALSVEAPRPFYVAGSVEVCVSVKILKKKITKCCDVSFVWQTSDPIDTSPAPLLADVGPPAASATHMISGATYEVAFSTSAAAPPDSALPPIPLDCYIDVKFSRPIDPSAVSPAIGGYTAAAEDAGETVPPRYGTHIVTHAYTLEEVALETLEGGIWVDYNPYAALAPDAMLDPTAAAQIAASPIGMWQKKSPGYNDLRFLALTPFSWMAPAVGHRPEELGITSKSTYCVGRIRKPRCTTWAKAKSYPAGLDQFQDGVLYRVDGDRMEAAAFTDSRRQPFSLAIGPSGQAVFQFPEPVAECEIDLVTTAPWVRLHWQRRKPMVVNGILVGSLSGPPEYEDVAPPVTVPRAALTGKQSYSQPADPIDRLLIETPVPDLARIAELEEAIAQAEFEMMFVPAMRVENERLLAELRAALKAEHAKTCIADGDGGGASNSNSDTEALHDLEERYRELAETLAGLDGPGQRFCPVVPPPRELPRPPATTLAATLRRWATAILDRIRAFVAEPPPPPPPPPREEPQPAPQTPCKFTEDVRADAGAIREAGEKMLAELEKRIEEIRGAAAAGGDSGWTCGTFVRELCWLTQKDFDSNASLPAIDAIAADYSAMTAAIKKELQPIWAPGRNYRIRLRVADTVCGTPSPSDHYVHFRTDTSIGLFQVAPAASSDPNLAGASYDDGRQEVPERSLLHYVDVERSRPNAKGKITNEKPVYFRNVEIRLFFDKTYAYHFFADWPGNGQKYALEIAVQDPAETAGDTNAPPHLAPIVAAPYVPAQSWPEDLEPKIPLELRTLEAFRDQVALPDPDDFNLVCLSEGGDPIVPAARSLLAEIPELDPNKLYTVVVRNRRTDTGDVAEVMRYGMVTSHFADQPSHFHSYRLKGADGSSRLAVFDIVHTLPGIESQTIAAALGIVGGGGVADKSAWPDPFDGLVHGLLKLPPRPPAPTVEFNFVTAGDGTTFGLLIDGPEPLYDPRLPPSAVIDAITLHDNGVQIDREILFSRDRARAFLMVPSGAFPIQNVAIGFALLDWQGDVTGSVVSDAFSKI